jgi:hypothetical protein
LLGNDTRNASPRQRWPHSTVKHLRKEVFFHAVRRQADSDATMEHVTLRRTHQQINCKKCFLRGPPRGYIRRANGRFELVRSSEIVPATCFHVRLILRPWRWRRS